MNPKIPRITTRNARFQEWQALLANRRKPQRPGEFIVQGVRPVTILGTDEKGDVDVADHDLTGPTLIVVGNEASGLSEAWRAASDRIARVPITGSVSSLNAASATTVLLYEADRQRRTGAEG